MPKNKISYTEEQIQLLQQNPFTHSVTPHAISFTVTFKEFFYEQMSVPGMTTKKIMEKAGYDPSFFSRSALDSIRKMVRYQAASPNGFSDPKGLSQSERIRSFAEKDLSRQRTKTTLAEMQKRIAHLEAEIDFLKKIHFLEKNQKNNT